MHQREPIVFRADGGSQMGMGHIVRSMTLARKFVDAGHPVSFVAAEGTPFADHRSGIEWITIPRGCTPETERRFIAARCARPALLVLDGYHFDIRYRAALKELAPLLVIDDLAVGRYDADLIVNPSLHGASVNYDAPLDCVRCLGPEYALIRPAFKPPAHRKGFGRNLLICFGGSDPTDLTRRAVLALDSQDLPIRVVLGPAYGGAQRLGKGDGARRVEILENANMPEQFAWADVALISASTLSLEALACGVPSIVIPVAENQLPVADAARELRCAHALGWHETIEADTLRHAVVHLLDDPEERQRLASLGPCVVDGKGPERVLSAVKVWWNSR